MVGISRVPGQASPIDLQQNWALFDDKFSLEGTPDGPQHIPQQPQPQYNAQPAGMPMSFLAKQRKAASKGTLKTGAPVSQPGVFPKQGKQPGMFPKQGKEPFGQMLRPEERAQLGMVRQPGKSRQSQERTVINRPGMSNR